jgi:hypothetical protein
MAESKAAETHIEGLPEFNEHADLFRDLTLRTFVETGEGDLINGVISYDSKYCIVIVTEDEERFEIQGYDIKRHNQIFAHEIEGEFLKMNLIE